MIDTTMRLIQNLRPMCCLGFLALTSGCSLAPQTLPMDAYALGDGQYAYGVDVVPTQSLRVHRGFGEHLELGVQIEPVMLTGFAKYTLLDKAGFAAALYVAGTTGPDDGYSASSIQAGSIFSYTYENLDVSLSARHSNINYDPLEPDSRGTDAPGIDVTDDSLNEYTTADLLFSIRLRNLHARLKFGVTCTSYDLIEPSSGIQGCVPVLGIVHSAPRLPEFAD